MKQVKQSKTSKWFPEVEWLATNLEKFNVDYLKVIVYAKGKEMPEPKPNIANILRGAAAAGIIEPMEAYRKSDWKGCSRVPRQFWRKAKIKVKESVA